jgi:hypothetical protein
VIVNVSEWDTERHLIDVTIELKNLVYLCVPILELADRSNVWWTTYNHALDRLNLGQGWICSISQDGMISLKPRLNLIHAETEIEYRFPYFNRDKPGPDDRRIAQHQQGDQLCDHQQRRTIYSNHERKLLERWKERSTPSGLLLFKI